MVDFLIGVLVILMALIWVIGFPVMGTLLMEAHDRRCQQKDNRQPEPKGEPMPDTREYLEALDESRFLR